LKKIGLANLTGQMLREGTGSKKPEQIDEELDFMGSSLDISVEKDFMLIDLKVLKKFWGNAGVILTDILLNPSFSHQEINDKKEEILAIIKRKNEDPEAMAEDQICSLIFAEAPYGHSVLGDVKSVEGLNKGDILDFYRRFYIPNNTIISFVGDINKTEIISFLNKYFLKWHKKESLPNFYASPLTIEKAIEQKIIKDIPQTTVIIGSLGISRDDPEYYSLSVANLIFGGSGLSSRLMKNLREQKGLVYNVSSFFSARKHVGEFGITLQTKNESVDKAVNSVFLEMINMRNNVVTKDELNNAKSFLKGSFPLRIDTLDKISHFLCLTEFFNLGLDYDTKYSKLIDKVTREDILRVSRKFFDAEKFAVVKVGK
jgi:zinc protease